MPICKKCKESFPNWLKIDGKLRQLNKRKYCLACSPFGKHNTKRLDKILNHEGKDIRICRYCFREFEWCPSKGNKGWICRSCHANRKRHKRKLQCIDYKGGKCEKCKYNKCQDALTFHHNDPSIKNFGIAGSHCRAWKIVKIELDKCTLLCRNCHAEEHSKDMVGTSAQVRKEGLYPSSPQIRELGRVQFPGRLNKGVKMLETIYWVCEWNDSKMMASLRILRLEEEEYIWERVQAPNAPPNHSLLRSQEEIYIKDTKQICPFTTDELQQLEQTGRMTRPSEKKIATYFFFTEKNVADKLFRELRNL